MIPILENAVLGSDLDMDGFVLKNVSSLLPVPPSLLDTSDARLGDQRSVTSGSVTNSMVSDTASIVQSKLSLDDVIPSAWLGAGATQAAKGSLVQFLSLKGGNNGYCDLDSSGKMPISRLPSTGPQSGTVTIVGLMMPPEFSVSGSPIKTSGTFSVSWVNEPDKSWFGVHGPPYSPSFLTKQIPVGFVPSLPGSIFTTGMFPVAMLPVAIGMGTGHAKGVVPDPGDGGSEGMPDDYLGRDMKYHHFDMDKSYQPMVQDVNIFVASYVSNTKAMVTIRSKLLGSSLFYDIGTEFVMADTTGEFDVHTTITMNVGDIVKAYAAKSGYNNSAIASFKVPPPPQPQV